MRPKLSLLALLAVFVLTGCAGVKGYPKYFPKYNSEFLKLLYDDITQGSPADSTATKQKIPRDPLFIRYQNCTTAPTINCRNEIVGELMLFIDFQYNQFRAKLYEETVLTGITGNLATVGLSTAGALAGIGGASNAVQSSMSALTAGIAGAQAAYDKEVLFSQTMPALISFMDSDRKTKANDIYTKFRSSYDSYPLPEAITDVNAYFLAGTLPGAINSLTTVAATKAKQSEDAKATALEAKKVALQQLAQANLKGDAKAQCNALTSLTTIFSSSITLAQKSTLSSYEFDPAKISECEKVTKKMEAILYYITMIQDDTTYQKVNIAINTAKL